jgi:hypothetical protein
MHRILLREVVIDVPSESFEATRAFWSAALDTESRLVEDYPEFTALTDPAGLVFCVVPFESEYFAEQSRAVG